MYNEFEEYFEDKSYADDIFDTAVSDLKGRIKNSVKEHFDNIARENNSLRELNQKLKNEISEVNRLKMEYERKLESVETEFLKGKAFEIMKHLSESVEAYYVYHSYVERDKCSYCNEERKVVSVDCFGRETFNDCLCLERKRNFCVKPVYLNGFELCNSHGKQFDVEVYYTKSTMYDKDKHYHYDVKITDTVESIANTSDFEEYDEYTVFRHKEDAQKFCDYLIEKNKNN